VTGIRTQVLTIATSVLYQLAMPLSPAPLLTYPAIPTHYHHCFSSGTFLSVDKPTSVDATPINSLPGHPQKANLKTVEGGTALGNHTLNNDAESAVIITLPNSPTKPVRLKPLSLEVKKMTFCRYKERLLQQRLISPQNRAQGGSLDETRVVKSLITPPETRRTNALSSAPAHSNYSGADSSGDSATGSEGQVNEDFGSPTSTTSSVQKSESDSPEEQSVEREVKRDTGVREETEHGIQHGELTADVKIVETDSSPRSRHHKSKKLKQKHSKCDKKNKDKDGKSHKSSKMSLSEFKSQSTAKSVTSTPTSPPTVHSVLLPSDSGITNKVQIPYPITKPHAEIDAASRVNVSKSKCHQSLPKVKNSSRSVTKEKKTKSASETHSKNKLSPQTVTSPSKKIRHVLVVKKKKTGSETHRKSKSVPKLVISPNKEIRHVVSPKKGASPNKKIRHVLSPKSKAKSLILKRIVSPEPIHPVSRDPLLDVRKKKTASETHRKSKSVPKLVISPNKEIRHVVSPKTKADSPILEKIVSPDPVQIVRPDTLVAVKIEPTVDASKEIRPVLSPKEKAKSAILEKIVSPEPVQIVRPETLVAVKIEPTVDASKEMRPVVSPKRKTDSLILEKIVSPDQVLSPDTLLTVKKEPTLDANEPVNANTVVTLIEDAETTSMIKVEEKTPAEQVIYNILASVRRQPTNPPHPTCDVIYDVSDTETSPTVKRELSPTTTKRPSTVSNKETGSVKTKENSPDASKGTVSVPDVPVPDVPAATEVSLSDTSTESVSTAIKAVLFTPDQENVPDTAEDLSSASNTKILLSPQDKDQTKAALTSAPQKKAVSAPTKLFKIITETVSSKMEIEPTASSVPKMEIEPTASSVTKMEIEPTASSIPKMEIEPTALFVPKMEIEPTALTVPKMEIEPTAASFFPKMKIEPTASSVSEMEIEPTALFVPKMEIEPTASFVPKMEIEPTALSIPKMEIESTASFVPKMKIEPTASSVSEMQIEPTASSVPMMEIEPTASSVPMMEIEPTASSVPMMEIEPTASSVPMMGEEGVDHAIKAEKQYPRVETDSAYQTPNEKTEHFTSAIPEEERYENESTPAVVNRDENFDGEGPNQHGSVEVAVGNDTEKQQSSTIPIHCVAELLLEDPFDCELDYDDEMSSAVENEVEQFVSSQADENEVDLAGTPPAEKATPTIEESSPGEKSYAHTYDGPLPLRASYRIPKKKRPVEEPVPSPPPPAEKGERRSIKSRLGVKREASRPGGRRPSSGMSIHRCLYPVNCPNSLFRSTLRTF